MVKSKKYISIFLKLIIAGILIYTVYHQLFIRHDFTSLKKTFLSQLGEGNMSYLLLTFLLMFLNWFFEIIRWRNLVNTFHPIGLKKATTAIMMGVTMGMISPQRIGEYAGRLMAVPSNKNWLSIKANFYTSLTLNFVILICGLLAMNYLINRDLILISFSANTILLAGLISLILITILLVFFPQIERIFKLEKLFTRIKKWGSFSDYQFSKRSLAILLVLSFARYIVFLSQYVLLLCFFGVELDIRSLLACVAIVYLIQSSLPLPAMLSLLARGEIAILVFSMFNVNEISILATTFGLWIINLLLPAFFGLILLWKTRLLETIGIESN